MIMSTTSPTEKEGIKAIIALQAAIGITETPAKARAGWRSMSKGEKETTLAVYKTIRGMKEEHSYGRKNRRAKSR